MKCVKNVVGGIGNGRLGVMDVGEITNCQICGKYRDCTWYWIDSNKQEWKEIMFRICQKCEPEIEERIKKIIRV